MVVDLAGGVSASLRCSIAEDSGQWLRVTGARGELNFAGAAFTAAGDCELELSQGAGTTRKRFGASNAYGAMLEAVARSVRGESCWVVPWAQSRNCAAVLAAARASALAGGAPTPLP
jgi:hypothetical protein